MNLRPLNPFIPYEHFKMEGIPMLRDLLRKGDFMVKIDLKDPYFTVRVWQNHQTFPRFVWKETMYEFACKTFETCSAPVTTTEHQTDSPFRQHANYGSLPGHCPSTCLNCSRSFSRVGVHDKLNYVKSVLVPSTKMECLGFVVDPITLSLALPRDKIRNVRKECQTLLDSQLVTSYLDILPFQGPSTSTTYKTRKTGP